MPSAAASAALSAAAAAALALGLLAQQRHVRSERAAFLAGLAQPQRYRASPVVIVLDVGSSSVRASCFALVRADGRPEWVLVDGSMQQQHADAIDEHGEADIHLLRATAERLVDGALDFLRAVDLADRVVGVGFSTFAMNVLGVDADGEPVTPVFTYAGRRPGAAACARQLREALVSRGALDDAHDRTGTVIHPAYAPATFLRLHHEEPSVAESVHKWQSISGYLIGRWTGSNCVPISYSEASWMGLLDFRHAKWDAQLLEMVRMDTDKMPPVVDSSTPFMGLAPAFANRWPELQNVPFFLGVGDGAAANIGSKCMDSSRIAVTIGTSAALRVVLPLEVMRSAKVPRGLWCYRIGKEQVLLGGALSDGGSVYQFFRRILRLDEAKVDAELAQLRPTEHGLSVLPFLSGERAPGWVEDATCTITGISKWTSPLEMLRAGMESIALRIGVLLSLVANHAEPGATIVASGTALAKSRVWRQMLADCTGKELLLETSATETTSRGIAALAGSYLSLHTLEETSHLADENVDVQRANVTAHAAYLEARHSQERLYRSLYE